MSIGSTDDRPADAASVRQDLVLESVSYAIAGRQVVKDISLTVRDGEFFTLLGPSGCGKTTLLRLIAGFESPQTGSISLGATRLEGLPAARRPINTVFQNYALFPHLNVAGNVAFGLRMLKWSREDIAERVDEVLGLVQLLDLRHRRVSELSGGQQQRVALARALAPSPKVLLLDEPLSALDLKLRRDMQVELKRIQTELRQTVIFVTHDQEEALSMSDRIAIMRDGDILQCETPAALYTQPADRFVAAFLGEANFLSAKLRAIDNFHATVEMRNGQTASIALGRHMPAPGEVTVMFRPEDVELGSGPGLSLTASVIQKSYLGSDLSFQLHLRDGTPVKLRSRASAAMEALRIGQQVPLSIPFEQLRIVGETR
ncbi:ABC transporter ATP-binding protein [Shinella curvata]|uniref:ABC transporter ATP-binding protein n=1 Tax=Shinella curvata TaxID=1817964 RepID=UPI0031405037